MEYEVLKGKVVYFKKAIPNHKEIIECLEKTKSNIVTEWVPWGNEYATSIEQKKSAESLYGYGKSIYSPLFDSTGESKDHYWVYNQISSAIEECSSIYKSLMNIDYSVNPKLDNTGFVVGKYIAGKARGSHIDCPYDDLEHSYVLYLNDDHEGGEIEFSELKIRFKPEAGSVVMFKSSDPENIHQGCPIISGYKYIIPHFWRMGPSQGFITLGTSIEEHIEYVSNEDNLSHDYENLNIVNEQYLKKQNLENRED